MSLRIGPIKLI